MKKYYLFIVLGCSLYYFTGCGPSKEVSGNKEEKKVVKNEPPKETKPVVAKIRKYDDLLKAFIKNSNYEYIDKLKFDYDENGQLVNKGKLSSTKFDKNGDEEEAIFYDDKGAQEYKYEYVYENGLLKETIRYNKKGKQDKKYVYSYDKNNNKKRVDRYDANGNVDKYYLYTFNIDGNIEKEEWFDKSGTLEFKIINKFDVDGSKTESTTYTAKDKIAAKYSYNYDKKGNIIEEIRLDASGKQIGIIQYIYK